MIVKMRTLFTLEAIGSLDIGVSSLVVEDAAQRLVIEVKYADYSKIR